MIAHTDNLQLSFRHLQVLVASALMVPTKNGGEGVL